MYGLSMFSGIRTIPKERDAKGGKRKSFLTESLALGLIDQIYDILSFTKLFI